MAVTKALADEQRVRMLLALRRQELCVCQIVELVGLATSTVSKHMSILKQARLVESRKEGRWMYYRLPCDDAPELVRQAMGLGVRAPGQRSVYPPRRAKARGNLPSRSPHPVRRGAMIRAVEARRVPGKWRLVRSSQFASLRSVG